MVRRGKRRVKHLWALMNADVGGRRSKTVSEAVPERATVVVKSTGRSEGEGLGLHGGVVSFPEQVESSDVGKVAR